MSCTTQSSPRLTFRFYLQVVICAVLWGSAFPVIKNSYTVLNIENYGEQLVFAGSRFVLAGLLLLPFCRNTLIRTVCHAPRGVLLTIILGQTYLQYLFFYYGLNVSSGTLGALLVGSGSFWWMILAPLTLKTPRPTRWHWFLLVGCCVGIVCAVYTPDSDLRNVCIGTGAFLLATLSGSFGAIAMKRVSPTAGTLTPTCVALGAGGLLLMLTAAPYWQSYFSHFNLSTLLVTLYLAFVSAVGFSLWNQLIRHYSVNTLSSFRFMIPLMGVVESVLFIPGERLRLGIIIGGVMILSCLIAVSRIKEAPVEGRGIRP